MKTRLLVRLAIACIALLIYLVIRVIHPTRATFSPANMSIDAGKGWKEVKVPTTLAICSPRLVGASGLITAFVMDDDLKDVNAAVDKMETKLVASGKAATNGFMREDFTTASGLAGVHFSYTGKLKTNDTEEVRSHYFIARNMHSQCVSISYITSPARESSETIAAIARTLRVE